MITFFVAQAELDETKATIPPGIPLPEHSFNRLSTSPLEVETVLKSLQLGKATGPANITSFFKKYDPSVVSNDIPKSLLSAVGKVLEKIVHKQLFRFTRAKPF